MDNNSKAKGLNDNWRIEIPDEESRKSIRKSIIGNSTAE